MNRNVIRYILTMAGVVLFSCLFGVLGSHSDVVRYHQHQEEPGEAELGICKKCQGESQLCTHLPIISVDTGEKKIPGDAVADADGRVKYYEKSDEGEEEIPVNVQIIAEEGTWHHPTDDAGMSLDAMFRIRGNTSRLFDKKNYRIKLVSKDDPSQKEEKSLLGMTKGSEWSLHGPYLDKTLMRNYVWMNLSAEVMGYAPNVRFCEVMIDGEYKGVYVLMEMIDEGEGKIDLTDYEEGDFVFSYMVRIEPQSELIEESENTKALEDFSFYTMRLEPNTQMELIYPGRKYQTEEVKQYVETDLSEMERRLYSTEMEKDPDSCWDYLDLESFANYYILQEYLAVNDMFYASTYFYKDVRGKLHIGPVWDYNNVLDNFLRQMPKREFLLPQKGWYSQLMKSKKFVNYVTERYRELRKGVLSDQNIESYVKEVEDWLGSAIDRNYEVWGYTFDVDQLSIFEKQRPAIGDNTPVEDLNPSNYGEAVDRMLDYAKDRGEWLDENIDTLHQYCHSSRNANERFD